jgi:hypothetical protein
MISGLPSIRAYLGFLIRHLREFAILCADNIVYTLSRGGTPDPGKCLLVRLDAIGDYILWSDAAKATKAHLARKGVAVVLLASPLPVAVTHKMECFGCNWSCVYRVPKGRPMPCVERVSVESVWRAVLQAIAENPGVSSATAAEHHSASAMERVK